MYCLERKTLPVKLIQTIRYTPVLEMCLRIGDTWWLDRRERSSGPKVGSQRVKLEAVFGKWE